MRSIEELLNTEDPAWPILKEWISLAKNKVEILPTYPEKAGESLYYTQVSTRSMMGAVVYETGGLLIDDGWIRILGSGCERMKRSLPSWNKGKTFTEYGEPAPYLLVADDAVGGFYAINGGYFGQDVGNIYYNAPDSVDWEAWEIGYSQFLLFCFETDLSDFYRYLRWEEWEKEVQGLNPDYAYIFTPFLWTKEGKDINKVSRTVVSISEAYNFNMEVKSAFK